MSYSIPDTLYTIQWFFHLFARSIYYRHAESIYDFNAKIANTIGINYRKKNAHVGLKKKVKKKPIKWKRKIYNAENM